MTGGGREVVFVAGQKGLGGSASGDMWVVGAASESRPWTRTEISLDSKALRHFHLLKLEESEQVGGIFKMLHRTKSNIRSK